MPIYSYKCHKCGFEDDILVRNSDQMQVTMTCPKCDSGESFTRTISTNTSFHLKGEGWYKNSSSEK